ncbi:MAG: hypothetical protein K2U26_14700 [Cyclobacteriaceae bacterium]|nr:hypothetical protein [Cyclobacteriaceae bacterium]
MKNFKQKNSTIIIFITLSLFMSLFMAGCKKEEPKKEDTPELITKATLIFTSVTGGGSPVQVTATDPDGEGVQSIKADGPINLATNRTYTLQIKLINGLVKSTDPGYDITEEVEEEGDEHQFFFSWTNNLFSNPSGNGNIDNRADAVNYEGGGASKDKNGRNLGIVTTWTTVTTTSALSGAFRILLKHQPNLKSDTSDANTGETDLDLTFTMNVQ